MSVESQSVTATSALLLTTQGCTYCASIKRVLQKLLDEGLLQHLDVVDLAVHPDIAKQYSVRSVPWLKLGPIILKGAQSEAELRHWLLQLSSEEGIGHYLEQLLTDSELNQAIDLVRKNPSWLKVLLQLVTEIDKDIKIRLGVSAIFEEFAGQPVLQALCPEFAKLAKHLDPRMRADAAHFLSLTHSPNALPYLQQLAIDIDREVREIAEDALVDQ